jgi:Domain of unknown function (DUF222)
METGAVCEEIENLHKADDDLAELDPFVISNGESILALDRESARNECVKTKAIGEFDASGEWALDGAQSAAAWLVTRCHLPKREAQRLVRRARALRFLPCTAAAFSAGDIGAAQVDALVSVRTPATEAALARDEPLLVGFATEMKYARFKEVLAYWCQRADPEGDEESELERRNRRDVYLGETISAMFLGAMTLDAVSGSIVSAELIRLERLLFEADWAEATERLGREPKVHELARTSAQRRADAMVEMAIRSAATPADARRPEPLITFLVGYEAFYGHICRIQGGPVVTPGTILEHLDGATFERIVFAPGTRIECSPQVRFFTGATRRAIEVRDQECTHEYCDVAAERCQIDHIVPSNQGGETTQENGRVHCGFHNRLRNHGPPESGGHGPEPGE